jgi:hypothetical protein
VASFAHLIVDKLGVKHTQNFTPKSKPAQAAQGGFGLELLHTVQQHAAAAAHAPPPPPPPQHVITPTAVKKTVSLKNVAPAAKAPGAQVRPPPPAPGMPPTSQRPAPPTGGVVHAATHKVTLQSINPFTQHIA